MKWTSAICSNPDPDAAPGELAAQVLSALGTAPDLAFLFASDHYRPGFAQLPASLRMELGGGVLVGCSASGVIGGGEEIEQRPAIGLVAARLPGVVVDAWAVTADSLAPGSRHSRRCTELADRLGAEPARFVLLVDPFTFPAEQLLRSLEQAFPASVIAGGLASGGRAPGEVALFLDDATYRSGALLVSLGGDIEMRTAVAQGCRPVGDPLFVSACDGNLIKGLDGQPPIEILRSLFARLDENDRAVMQHSLFVGIAMREGRTQYDPGDWLIRNIAGMDPATGAIWVGADLREKQVIQFHLRDARTAAEDLERVLDRLRAQSGEVPPLGALLFSCTGRGQGLFGAAGHDSGMFHRRIGAVPLGGFFCNGEIGPVGGRTFLHGYTSAFAVFKSRRASAELPAEEVQSNLDELLRNQL
ncbi:MAG: FIST C-terminal domain-containing protein [Gammaproteobacteria bacterium]|nr:FIST C-terminal domain-containing protein [Gammaproteobacteria bacterium]